MNNISRDIFHFNKMLHGGKMKPLDCYRWLEKRKELMEKEFKKEHGFYMNFSYNYLYPEIVVPLPDTYEEWQKYIAEVPQSVVHDM